ncbi:HAMP domain-containing sensor histidine kinase [Romboutsia hominis]|uniref:histidine kinase n=1 Tax=Romboutsia hominis TaxID=1507512 RepID=A0A2P2BNZ9_9FIRM|nr:HAMP domain-containing sensor histidine kinase [Romboutsia hominis]MCH1959244.1 HAMP domain-containing histidine kinase [Romboutsia hominis]MCH1970143.1 HAMP domain-containing histidine kinase [Romboutsia hominis]CEI72102.1 Sensor histidine kinase YclK [Romboutsia hominis]
MSKCLFKKIYKTIGLSSIVFAFISILFCSVIVKQYFIKIEMEEIEQKLDETIYRYHGENHQLAERLKIALGSGIIINGYDFLGKQAFRYYTIDESKHNIDYEKVNETIGKQIKHILDGESIKGVTKVDGIDGNSIFVAKPIIQDEKVFGAVIAIKPQSELNKTLLSFYTILIVSLILLLISTAVPVYLVTKKTLKPLKDITDVTINMSKGDFSKRIDESESKDDEFGELIKAFNYLSYKLEQNDKDIKLLEKMRRDYVANISHELKTPITSIRAVAESLNDDMIDWVDRKRYYSMILRESVRLQALIKDMLELSRLQNPNEVIEKQSLCMGCIIKEVREKFEVIAEDLDINFITPSEEVKYNKVFTNYNRVIQVLVILLDNAFKFTDEEGTVSVEIEEEEEFIKVIVSDTGSGIEDEDLLFVFDRFYKADKSRKSEGTGIGLSIAAEIMTRLDEKIYVESEVGVGSRFIFTLHYK